MNLVYLNKKGMKVSEIMSTPVIITAKTNKVNAVRNLLDRKNVHAIPVLDSDGKIEGIVSSIDIAKEHNENEIVGNIMSEMVHVILPTSRVVDAAKMLFKHKVHHLVVMEEGVVVGMISSMDIVRVFAEQS